MQLSCILFHIYWTSSENFPRLCSNVPKVRWVISFKFCSNFHTLPVMQTFWKSVKIWESFRGFKGGNFFETQCNFLVTCKIKLFQNYFRLRRRPSEIILFQRVTACLWLFQNYFRELLQHVNMLQHVHCRWNNLEIISELFQWLK